MRSGAPCVNRHNAMACWASLLYWVSDEIALTTDAAVQAKIFSPTFIPSNRARSLRITYLALVGWPEPALLLGKVRIRGRRTFISRLASWGNWWPEPEAWSPLATWQPFVNSCRSSILWIAVLGKHIENILDYHYLCGQHRREYYSQC